MMQIAEVHLFSSEASRSQSRLKSGRFGAVSNPRTMQQKPQNCKIASKTVWIALLVVFCSSGRLLLPRLSLLDLLGVAGRKEAVDAGQSILRREIGERSTPVSDARRTLRRSGRPSHAFETTPAALRCLSP